MNEPAPNQKQESPGVFTLRRIVLGVVCVVLLVVVVGAVVQTVLAPPLRNELDMRGTLEVAVNANVEVYIGNEFIGIGPGKVTWDDLLGPSKKPPLAIPLDPDVPSPNGQGMGGVTAEALAGAGSEIVWTKQGMSGRGEFLGGTFVFAWKKVLLRHANGDFDSLSVLDGEFPSRTGKWRRFLIPVRLRSSDETAGEFFFDSPSGSIGSPSGGPIPTSIIGPQLLLTLRVLPEPPPEEFVDQVTKTRLWKPGNQRH